MARRSLGGRMVLGLVAPRTKATYNTIPTMETGNFCTIDVDLALRFWSYFMFLPNIICPNGFLLLAILPLRP